MNKLIIGLVVLLVLTYAGIGQISITSFNTPYTEDFNTMANTGTSSILPVGWYFSESGTNANTLYTAGTGSSNTGDTYSLGASASTDRGLGALRSGSLIPLIGAAFVNNTGLTIESIEITYKGEQWRIGTLGREDRIDFQYSLNATSLTTGTWIDVNSLDFIAPVTSGTVGAIDGNTNYAILNYTIESLLIPNGNTFWIRFFDFDATGADDGLALDDWSLNAIECNASISGYYQYFNTGATVLNNVNIELRQSDVTVFSTTTNSSGYFEFPNVCPGIYDIVATKTKVNTGINSTDAAQVNYWSVHNSGIEIVRFLGGDVNGDQSVVSSDASHIQQYFITQGNPAQPFGSDWSFWKTGELINANPGPSGFPTITVPAGAASVTQNFYGLVTGDFNRSYVPGSLKSGSESLSLTYGGVFEVGLGSEFELPLYGGTDMEIGAISLILEFPADIMEVNAVYLSNNPANPVPYLVSGDEIRIGWNSLTPFMVQEGEPLVTLLLKMNEPAGDEEIRLKLAADPLNELADGSFEVIGNAVLVVDVVKTTATGLTEIGLSDGLTLSNHPNPFRGTTSFSYSLPVDGKVTLEIYDIVGNKVKVLVDEMQTAGEHLVKLENNEWQPGVYSATIRVENSGNLLKRTIKIINKNN